MSLGLPVVGSPIGSNMEIISDGINGFLADSQTEWYERLKLLLENAELRTRLGEKARQTVSENFDIQKQFDFVEDSFRSLTKTRK